MKTIVEFETLSAFGTKRELRITMSYPDKRKWLEIIGPGGLEAMVEVPADFQKRLALHNLGTD